MAGTSGHPRACQAPYGPLSGFLCQDSSKLDCLASTYLGTSGLKPARKALASEDREKGPGGPVFREGQIENGPLPAAIDFRHMPRYFGVAGWLWPACEVLVLATVFV